MRRKPKLRPGKRINLEYVEKIKSKCSINIKTVNKIQDESQTEVGRPKFKV